MFSKQGIVQQTLPQVVYIHVQKTDPDDDCLKSGLEGSGIIYHESGIIVTNSHITNEGTGFAVELYDGTILPAKLIGESLLTDLAVLKIDYDKPLPAVTIAKDDEANVGDKVFAIGSPLIEHLKGTATFGYISHLKRFGFKSKSDIYLPILQSNISLAVGSSGGGLFNREGHLVGINTLILGNKVAASFSGAINSSDVVWVVESILKTGYGPWKTAFGINLKPVTTAMAKAHNLPAPTGVIINNVTEGSLAESLGLKVSDLILKVGHILTDSVAALTYASMHAEGKRTTISISRAAQIVEIPLYIPLKHRKRVVKNIRGFDKYGFKLKNSHNCIGVQVNGVLPGSPAAAEGFLGDEVIIAIQPPNSSKWVEVNTPKTLREQLKLYTGNGVIIKVLEHGEEVLMALSC